MRDDDTYNCDNPINMNVKRKIKERKIKIIYSKKKKKNYK